MTKGLALKTDGRARRAGARKTVIRTDYRERGAKPLTDAEIDQVRALLEARARLA